MKHSLHLAFLLSSLSVTVLGRARLVSHDLARPTITPAPTLVKRQVARTLEVDDIANFNTATDDLSEPLPTADHIRIIENEDGSIDLLMGSDLQAQIQETRQTSCSNIQDAACQSAVQANLQEADFGVQARQAELLIGAGWAIGSMLSYFAYLFTHMDTAQPVPQRINVPSAQVAQIASATESAASIAIATSGGDAVTVPVASQVVSGSMTTETNDAGDIVFEFNDAVVQWFSDEAANTDTCSAARVKRQLDNCVVAHGLAAMNALNGPLVDLLVMPNIPRLRQAPLLDAALQLFTAGRRMAEMAGITDDVIWDLSYLFVYIFDETLNQGLELSNTLTMGADDLEEPTSTSSSEPACPTAENSPVCPDDNCQGDPEGDQVCAEDSEYPGCTCLPILEAHWNRGSNEQWFNDQQAWIGQLLAGNPNPDEPDTSNGPIPNGGEQFSAELGNVQCSNLDRTPDGNRDFGMPLQNAEFAINYFCNLLVTAGPVYDGSSQDRWSVANRRSPNDDPVFVAVQPNENWDNCPTLDFVQDQQGSYDTCFECLRTALNSCDTDNPTNQEAWKGGGMFFRDCLTWYVLPCGSQDIGYFDAFEPLNSGGSCDFPVSGPPPNVECLTC